MSTETNDIDRQKCIARSTNRYLIGKDTEGRGHFYDPPQAVVWVMKPRKECIVVCYRTRDLGSWREYVAERAGWSWHNISSKSTPELVASALKEAQA